MHAKFYALMLAALAHCAHARVSFDEVMEMQSTEIGKSRAFINPRGPLCLLRGFVYSELAYTHNKRFFSPEIETDYKVEPVGDVETTEEHKYTRNAQNDKPYPSAEEPAVSSKPAGKNYAEEYHRTLIEMFPSVDGHTLSVAVAREDSFFQFLQGMPTKQHAHYVLAALLLLSEGVDVPIKATQKKITLGTSILGNLPPEHRTTVGKESSTVVFKTKKDLCKKAAQVINFFNDNKGKGKLPCTQNDFCTGDFLNTPQFLIQAYLFEYITSKSNALDFAACVHAILTSPLKKDCKDVYNTCFVESKAEAEGDELLHPLVQIQKAMKNQNPFPFTSPSMLPAYTSVHACKRGQTEFLDETFSNCVEAGLLALFCCLAHDPAQKKYDADAMLGEEKEGEKTEALRAFFQLESVTPKTCATKDTMQEWNRVVSGLQSEHIAYRRESRNEVRSGIFNALYVVAEVTGRREKEEPRIRELELMLDGQAGRTSGGVFEKTKKYVAELFASLSVDKSLKVSFSGLKVDVRSDGQKDLYGEITLKYTDKDSVIEQSICLAFQPRHLIVTLCPWMFLSSASGRKEAFFSVDGCPEPEAFAECLFAKYADAWRARSIGLGRNSSAENILKIAGCLPESRTSAHPNQLFVLGLALRYEQAQKIIEHFTLHAAAKGIELTQEHPGVRLLSNLLGSLPLDDFTTQYNVLQYKISLNMMRDLFPNIILSKEGFSIIYKNTPAITRIGRYTGDNCAPAANAILKYFREYNDKAGQPLFQYSQLKTCTAVSEMFPVLLADKSTRHIDEISTLLLNVEKKNREKALDTKAIFDLLLFLVSLKKDNTPPELVLALGIRVGPRLVQMYNSDPEFSLYISRYEAYAFLQALSAHKSALQQIPGGEEAFNCAKSMLQFTINDSY